jgi:UDP-N-acetylenolpyruvoylglucosamine reductase
MGSSTFGRLIVLRLISPAGELRELDRSQIAVEYRRCPILDDHLALSAVFRCVPEAKDIIDKRSRLFNEKRWGSQPAASSAGCIFKNPCGISAGRLIDELGLKGVRVGGAVISDVHANFIVNLGSASSADVLQLMAVVRDRVMEARGIRLEAEVEIVGEDLGAQQVQTGVSVEAAK